MGKLSFLISILFVCASCSNQYKIDGTSSLSGLDGKTIYLKTFRTGGWQSVDSAEVIHGSFSMKGKADTIMMTVLFVDNRDIMPIVLENGNIKVNIAYPKLSARGTSLNNSLYDFMDKKNDYEIKIEEMESKEARMVMEGHDIDLIRDELFAEKDKLSTEINTFIKDFISSNYNNVLGPNVFMMMCSGLELPVITPQMDEILKDAPYSFKNDALVKEFLKNAKEYQHQLEEYKRLNTPQK